MKTYYTITEVSKAYGIPASKIRFFCDMHNEFLNPKRNGQYNRKFKDCDIETLLQIHDLTRVMNHTGINEVLQGKIKIEFL